MIPMMRLRMEKEKMIFKTVRIAKRRQIAMN
jgi:hypothetical protein